MSGIPKCIVSLLKRALVLEGRRMIFFEVYFEIETMSGREAEREGEKGSQAGFTVSAQSLKWDLNSRTMRS